MGRYPSASSPHPVGIGGRLPPTFFPREDLIDVTMKKSRSVKDHGPSIKNPDVYEALRRDGMSKSKAAAISNAAPYRNGRGTRKKI